MIVIKNSNQP